MLRRTAKPVTTAISVRSENCHLRPGLSRESDIFVLPYDLLGTPYCATNYVACQQGAQGYILRHTSQAWKELNHEPP